jgi:hypothetical protein
MIKKSKKIEKKMETEKKTALTAHFGTKMGQNVAWHRTNVRRSAADSRRDRRVRHFGTKYA